MNTLAAKSIFLLLVSVSLLTTAGCKERIAVESLSVSIRNTELYQHPTVGGDEEGARISIQAQHYNISEIRRDSATKWIATYLYQPAAGYTGTDDVELELFTGSDGGTAPTNVKKARLHFVVHE